MKNKEKVSNIDSLPSSIWTFYAKYASKGMMGLIVAWGIFYLIANLNEVAWPIFNKLFIGLFENNPIINRDFFAHAIQVVLLIVSIEFVYDIIFLIQNMFRSRLTPKMSNHISSMLTDYVQHQSMSFWTERMSGKVFSQIGYVADGFMVIENFFKIIALVLVMSINLTLIMQINLWLALIFAFAFIVRFVYSWVLIKPLNKTAQTSSNARTSLAGHTVDSISNYYVVKLFAGAQHEEKYLEKPRQERIKTFLKSAFMQRVFYGFPMFLWDFCHGILLISCVMLFAHGQMKVSEIVFALTVFMSIMSIISFIVNQIPDIVEKIGSATDAYKGLVVPIDIKDVPNATDIKVSKGKIEFKDVSFKYKNKYVLRNLNLIVNPGEKIGIVGASGAGKTTLVNLLMRFYDPQQGHIFIDSQNIHDVKQDSLRRNISFIPQEPTMFNRNIKENIAYGKPNASDKNIRKAAKFASVDTFIMSTEDKYLSMVGDKGIKLSGGQKQRIAIARAFLKNAPILVLDEATSALDSETELYIQKSFDKLSSGRTTIAIAHRLSTLRNMDRIVVLEHGHVVEQGSHQTLLRKKGIYARLWNMQSGGFLQDEK